MARSLCVLTAYDSRFKDFAAMSVPSMRRFAGAHGYALRAIEREDCVRRGGWIKVEPILKVLAEDFDYVLWLDIDTFVARTDIDIRNVTHAGVHLHLAWHKPIATGDPPHFNTGVMLIRRCEWSRNFFNQVWETGPIQHRWNDQATILQALGFNEALLMGANREDASNHPVGLLNITWNSIPEVCALEDPVIWHFAGMEMSARLAAMAACASPKGTTHVLERDQFVQ